MAQQKLKLSEKQTLLPAVITSMKLLGMDQPSLIQYINSKYLENPVLELTEQSGNLSLDAMDYSGIESRGNSLEEYVCRCIGESKVPGKVAVAAEYLAGHLDPDGYLDLEGVPDIPCMNEAISLIQSFTPAGLGARNITECLMIQLKQMGKLTRDLEILCRDCLEDISKSRIDKIARKIGKSRNETEALVELVRSLNPRPASSISDEPVKYIIPDVVIIESEGKFIALINDSVLPAVSILKLNTEGKLDDKELDTYVREKEREARSLIQALNYRKTTLTAVAQRIIDIQEDVLRYGMGCLKPLRMKDIANQLTLNPSTVSRICADKYMEYNGQIFPFSCFFSSILSGQYGDVSSEMVRNVISEIIDKEDGDVPLTDLEICIQLEQSGIAVSRRTVAKYRKISGIPSSYERKRRKRK